MKRTIISLMILAAASAQLFAQTTQQECMVDEQRRAAIASTRYLEFGGSKFTPEEVDSINRVITEYYVDQFRGFQDPEAPYFMFMSKDSQLGMGLGGCVRIRGWYDIANVVPANGFAPYLIPMNGADPERNRLGATPAGTSLFFRVIGRNKLLGHYQVYIEANFNGYQQVGFKLKKAYAIVRDFTIGYAASTYGDPAAMAPVIDAQGANNKISNTAVLLRYMRTWKSRWTVAGSVEWPKTAVDVDNVSTGKVGTTVPDAAAFVQYGWGRSSHVRLSGILRSVGYRDLITAANHRRAAYGVMLSATGHPHRQVTLYGAINYGLGTSSLGGDLICGNYDMLPDPAEKGKMYAPSSMGYSVGVQYNFLPNLFMSASFSQTRLFTGGRAEGSEYKYGLWAAANIFWNLTPRIQAGAEFDWGQRHNFDDTHAHAARIGLMCQFSF